MAYDSPMSVISRLMDRLLRHGLPANHPHLATWLRSFDEMNQRACRLWGADPLAAVDPTHVSSRTLQRACGGGLWKRLHENWEIADFFLRTSATQSEPSVISWLVANEDFFFQLAIESRLWTSDEYRRRQESGFDAPKTLLLDDRLGYLHRTRMLPEPLLEMLRPRAVATP